MFHCYYTIHKERKWLLNCTYTRTFYSKLYFVFETLLNFEVWWWPYFILFFLMWDTPFGLNAKIIIKKYISLIYCFLTVVESVYSAVRTDFLYKADYFVFKRLRSAMYHCYYTTHKERKWLLNYTYTRRFYSNWYFVFETL